MSCLAVNFSTQQINSQKRELYPWNDRFLGESVAVVPGAKRKENKCMLLEERFSHRPILKELAPDGLWVSSLHPRYCFIKDSPADEEER